MIIAFGHKKQQGKDTATNILYTHIRQNQKYGVTSYKCAFADYLYTICNLLIPEFEHKNTYDYDPSLKEVWIDRLQKTPRRILIDVGQHMKEILGIDCFAVALLKNIKGTDYYLISDLRFPIEAQMVKDKGGICVKVTRPGFETKSDEVDEALDGWDGWDYELVNDGTLEEFEKKVIDLYERIVDGSSIRMARQ